MKRVILALVLLSGPAHAQSSPPAKMFVIANNGVAITDYPSLQRCEASKADMERQAARENATTPPIEQLPGGGAIFRAPIAFRAFCFRA